MVLSDDNKYIQNAAGTTKDNTHENYKYHTYRVVYLKTVCIFCTCADSCG